MNQSCRSSGSSSPCPAKVGTCSTLALLAAAPADPLPAHADTSPTMLGGSSSGPQTSAIFNHPGRLEGTLLRVLSRWRGQGINPGRDPSGVRRSRTHDENHLKEQLQRRTRCALILDLDLMATPLWVPVKLSAAREGERFERVIAKDT